MTVVLASVRFQDISALPRDTMTNDFVFTDSDLTSAIALVHTAVPDFYNTTSAGGQKVASFISKTMRRDVSTIINTYDITSHLDGSPHGSPVDVFGFTLAAGNSDFDIPSEVAVCLSYHGDLTGLAEVGATDTAIPTPEAAIDMGAPTTHTGKDRPKARKRGRIFIGPLTNASTKQSAGTQCTVADNLVTALKDGGTRLL